MKTISLNQRRAVIVGGIFALCLFFIVTGLQMALNRDAVKENVRVRISKILKGELQYEQIRFYIFPRPHAKLTSPLLLHPENYSLKARAFDISLEILPLFTGSFKPHSISVIDPRVTVHIKNIKNPQASRQKKIPGENFPPMISSALSIFADYGRHTDILIKNGTLLVKKMGKPDLEFKNIFATIGKKNGDSAFLIKCSPGFSDQIHMEGIVNPKTANAKGRMVLSGFKVQQLPDALLFPGRSFISESMADITIDFNTENLNMLQADITGTISRLKLRNQKKTTLLKNGDLKGRLFLNSEKSRIHIQSLRFAEPGFLISGTLTDDKKAENSPSKLTLDMAGTDIHIPKIREMVLALAGHKRLARNIFRIVKGGRIDTAVLTAKASRWSNLFTQKSFHLKTFVSNGLFYIPGIKMDARKVKGPVSIENGVLSANQLTGAFKKTTVKNGSLKLGLSRIMKPFHLSADVNIDLAEFVPRSVLLLSKPKVSEEFDRISTFEGRAKGRLVLDKKEHGLDLDLYFSDIFLTADYNRLFAPLKVNAGRLLYKNKKIFTENLSGSIGQSLFSDITSWADWNHGPRLSIDSGKAELCLEELMPWLENFEAIKPRLRHFSSSCGTLAFNAIKINGNPLKPNDMDFDVKGDLINVEIHSPDLPEKCQIPFGGFGVRPGEFSFIETNVHLQDASIQLNARLNGNLHGPHHTLLTASGKIGPESAKWLGSVISPLSIMDLKSDIHFDGIEFEHEKEIGFAFKGRLAVANGPDVDVDLFKQNHRLCIPHLHVTDVDSNAVFSLNHDETGSTAYAFKGNINNKTLDVLSTQYRIVKGSINGDFKAVTKGGFYDLASVIGELEGDHVDLSFLDRFPVFMNRFSVSGMGDTLKTNDMSITLGNSNIDVKGSAQLLPEHIQLDLDVVSDTLSESTFKNIGSNKRKPEDPVATAEKSKRPIKGNILIDSQRADIKSVSFSPFSAQIIFDENRTDVLIDKAVFCGVNLPGNATLTNHDLNIQLSPVAKKKAFQPVLDCIWDKKIRIDGLFDLEGEVAVIGQKEMPIKKNLNGSFNLVSGEGRIHHLNLLSKIFAVLNVTEIFAGKGLDLTESGFGYDRADMQAEFSDETLIIKELLIDGKSMKITGSGKVDLNTGDMDITLLVAPLKTVDRITSKIPVVNYLTGGTLLSVPLKIKGHPDDPTIIPLPPDAIGKGILNIMERIIKAPIKIVESISE